MTALLKDAIKTESQSRRWNIRQLLYMGDRLQILHMDAIVCGQREWL